jgi:hypothetical protein
MPRGFPKFQRRTKAEKIAWLIGNPDLWAHRFIDRERMGELHKEVCAGLKEAGLVSPTSNCYDTGLFGMMKTAIQRMKKANEGNS